MIKYYHYHCLKLLSIVAHPIFVCLNYLQRAFDDFFDEGTHAIAVRSSVKEKKRRYWRVFALILTNKLPVIIICRQSRAEKRMKIENLIKLDKFTVNLWSN